MIKEKLRFIRSCIRSQTVALQFCVIMTQVL